MSIENLFANDYEFRDMADYVVMCDFCGAELPGEGSFYCAVEAKKEAGWKSVKVDGEWHDQCTDCQPVRNDAVSDFEGLY